MTKPFNSLIFLFFVASADASSAQTNLTKVESYFSDELCLAAVATHGTLTNASENSLANLENAYFAQTNEGKFAIVVGELSRADFDEFRQKGIASGLLPIDTYCLLTSRVKDLYEVVKTPPSLSMPSVEQFRGNVAVQTPNIVDAGHALIDGNYVEIGTCLYSENMETTEVPYGILAGQGLSEWMDSVGSACQGSIDFYRYDLGYEAFNSFRAFEIQLDWSSCEFYRSPRGRFIAEAPASYETLNRQSIVFTDDGSGVPKTVEGSELHAEIHYYRSEIHEVQGRAKLEGSEVSNSGIFDTFCVYVKRDNVDSFARLISESDMVVRYDDTFTVSELSRHYENSTTLEELFAQMEGTEFSAFLHGRTERQCFGQLGSERLPSDAAVFVVQVRPLRDGDFLGLLHSAESVIDYDAAPNYLGGGSPAQIFPLGFTTVTDEEGNVLDDAVARLRTH